MRRDKYLSTTVGTGLEFLGKLPEKFGVKLVLGLLTTKIFNKAGPGTSIIMTKTPLQIPTPKGSVGITALVPPELIYACGWRACDLNNQVPTTSRRPGQKLCAWTALWREMLLAGDYDIQKLVVVAGGDCLNAVVDGQKAEMTGFDTHYFFYPFREDRAAFREELEKLVEFLGGIQESESKEEVFRNIHELKILGLEIDRLRSQGKLPSTAFSHLIAFSDLRGNPTAFGEELRSYLQEQEEEDEPNFTARIALLGVPPINHDFHAVCQELGIQVVYDELPHEFLRCRGKTFAQITESYMNYSFSRHLNYRLNLVKELLEKRKVDGVIHYTQYACHHILEDELFRERLNLPLLTVQGDTPGSVSQQTRLRLEAFSELLD